MVYGACVSYVWRAAFESFSLAVICSEPARLRFGKAANI